MEVVVPAVVDVVAGAATGWPPLVRLLPEAVAGLVDSTYPLSQPAMPAATVARAMAMPITLRILRINHRVSDDIGDGLGTGLAARL